MIQSRWHRTAGCFALAMLILLSGCKRRSETPALPSSTNSSADTARNDSAPANDNAPAVANGSTPSTAVTPASAPNAYTPGEQITTGDPAWDRYLQALKSWQQDSQELVTARRPDLADISAATLRMHWALLDLKAARVRYLLAREPHRIVRDQGLAAFINIRWDEQDTAACAEHDPTYPALEVRVQEIKEQTRGHADYSASRQFLVDELLTDPEYRALVVQLKEHSDEVEKMLSPANAADGAE